ncbi:MAG: long-chain acyl-CoA synthetase [Bacteroidales bacterium]|jgi:long-chain acyl-CoA synthetase|nr:long-chain acyl-CoA synthetase [Bacteroidales bacterium]MDN5330506.1 long-chain acyl-CoA synthetase [Bacteroidales bacterium]NLH53237.1 long-chain fatty acid--CoA ligase [Bacteroidales bacterium]
MRVKRIFDFLYYNHERYHKDVVVAGKKAGKWVTYSSAQYIEMSALVSYALIELGIQAGDRIATISSNRPEWNFVDIGTLQIGAIHVPVYPSINEEELIYILKESGCRIVFTGNRYTASTIEERKSELPDLQKIICFDDNSNSLPFSEFLQIGRAHPQPEELATRMAQVNPEDIASIIYTSGTTSQPKGVMLTHENHVSNALVAAFTINLNDSHRRVSYLPLSHSYERMVCYTCLYLGISVYYADGVSAILSTLKEIKPHVLVSVPLLLEKVYQGILKKGLELKGIQKVIFHYALRLAQRFELNKEMGWWYNLQLSLARKIVFIKWKEALGGEIIKIITGGASVQPYLVRVFWAAGIPIYEGYGLTEASPLIAYNTEGNIKPGTVGKAIPDVVVKIAEDGELLVKGPNVMKGYYNQPEITMNVIDQEGWLHTGDLAEIDEEGFIKITGRKKEIFKLASGIYVYPEKLEGHLKQSLYISQAYVIGENQSILAALIQPNFDYIKELFAKQGIHFTSNRELINDDRVKSLIESEIKTLNGPGVKENETIQRFALVAEEWTIDTGELTPSLKLKRRVIDEKYKEIITGFFKDNLSNL